MNTNTTIVDGGRIYSEADSDRLILEVTIHEVSPDRELQLHKVMSFRSWAEYRDWQIAAGLRS